MKFEKLGVAALFCALALPAQAGIYGDDATRCLAKSATEADQLILVQWIFAGIARHPAIEKYSSITAEQRVQIDKNMSVLVTRLLSQDCRKEIVTALKYEGGGFLEKSFSALGEIAMGGLTTNPQVGEAMGAWAKDMDVKMFEGLAAEAGRPAPKPAGDGK